MSLLVKQPDHKTWMGWKRSMLVSDVAILSETNFLTQKGKVNFLRLV